MDFAIKNCNGRHFHIKIKAFYYIIVIFVLNFAIKNLDLITVFAQNRVMIYARTVIQKNMQMRGKKTGQELFDDKNIVIFLYFVYFICI